MDPQATGTPRPDETRGAHGPVDDAAVLAERWRDEQQRPRAEEDEPGGAGRAATTEVRG